MFYYFLLILFMQIINPSIERRLYSREWLNQLLHDKRDIYFRNEKSNEGEDADVPKVGELFEGDIIMDKDLREAVTGQSKRSAITQAELHHRRHWPNAVVPYVLDESLKPKVRNQILRAVKEFELCTCVKFIKRKEEENYVVFKDGKGCSSSVGMTGGRQEIHLAYGCKRLGTVMHEMMHCLGIIHTQSRADRDDYISIKYDNIKKDLLHNFKKYEYLDIDNLDTEYDYYSVMHYSNYAFSKNDKKTIISKLDPDLKFGQRKQLTSSDMEQINRLYPCNKNICTRRENSPVDLVEDMTAEDVKERKRDHEEQDLLSKLFY